jgi:hypothetical protein
MVGGTRTCAEDDDAVVSPTPREIVSHLGPQVLRADIPLRRACRHGGEK